MSVVIERVRLVEHADPDAAAERHAPGVGGEPAGEHRQQARLAVAVAADDADAVALVDAERDAVEDDLGRVLQVQGLGPEKMCHVPSRLGESGDRPAPGADQYQMLRRGAECQPNTRAAAAASVDRTLPGSGERRERHPAEVDGRELLDPERDLDGALGRLRPVPRRSRCRVPSASTSSSHRPAA